MFVTDITRLHIKNVLRVKIQFHSGLVSLPTVEVSTNIRQNMEYGNIELSRAATLMEC